MSYRDPSEQLSTEIDPSRLAELLSTDPQTVAEFNEQLQAVQLHLGQAGLSHVEPFGEVYLTMTGSVKGALKQAEFEDPERLALLTCTFGRFFFDALRGQLNGTRVPPVWDYLFNKLSSSRLGPELAVHGVISHIINDLPQATLAAGMIPGESEGDYFGVDRNIAYASYVLTNRHLPGPRAVKKHTAGRFGTLWAAGLRKEAWDDFLRLHEATSSSRPEAAAQVVDSIEQKALRASYTAARVGSVGSAAVGAASLFRTMPQHLTRGAA